MKLVQHSRFDIRGLNCYTNVGSTSIYLGSRIVTFNFKTGGTNPKTVIINRISASALFSIFLINTPVAEFKLSVPINAIFNQGNDFIVISYDSEYDVYDFAGKLLITLHSNSAIKYIRRNRNLIAYSRKNKIKVVNMDTDETHIFRCGTNDFTFINGYLAILYINKITVYIIESCARLLTWSGSVDSTIQTCVIDDREYLWYRDGNFQFVVLGLIENA